MYNRLKERPIRAVLRAAPDESRIRTGYQRAVSKVDAQVWVNPFYWATADHFRAYREAHRLPANPVKDALGMSGECLCGAYAHAGEVARVRRTCPETADRLDALERRVRDAGFPWGYEDDGPPSWYAEARRGQSFLGDWLGEPSPDDVGPMCHSCEKYSAHDPGEGTGP